MTPGNPRHNDDYQWASAWRDWCWWQCGFPLAVILATYPLARFLVEAKHSFEQAFASGDLLVFSALLLLGVTVEVRRLQIAHEAVRYSIALDNWQRAGSALACLVFLLFGAIKYHMLKLEGDALDVSVAGVLLGPGGDLPRDGGRWARAAGLAWVNIAACFASVCFSVWAFWASRQQVLLPGRAPRPTTPPAPPAGGGAP